MSIPAEVVAPFPSDVQIPCNCGWFASGAGVECGVADCELCGVGFGVATGVVVGVCVGLADGVGEGVGEDLAVGVDFGITTPLLHTSFFPVFTHV